MCLVHGKISISLSLHLLRNFMNVSNEGSGETAHVLSRVHTEMGKQNAIFFSQKRQNEKVHLISLILTLVIKKTGLPHKLNRIPVAPCSSTCF